MEKSKNESVYGYCPICGAPGISRERRPNGDDHCKNGHIYPSRHAVSPKNKAKKIEKDQNIEDIVEFL